jgi:hypothetical protein
VRTSISIPTFVTNNAFTSVKKAKPSFPSGLFANWQDKVPAASHSSGTCQSQPLKAQDVLGGLDDDAVATCPTFSARSHANNVHLDTAHARF